MTGILAKKTVGSWLCASLSLALLAAFSVSCARDQTVTPTAKSGVVYAYIGDAPACDVLSFRINVNGLSFRRAGTENDLMTIFPTAALFVSLHLDFATLRDYSTFMYYTPVRADSYDQANITLQIPKIVVYDPSQDPPIRAIDGVFTRNVAPIPLQPELKVTDTALSFIHFDFDMAKSLHLDSQGQVTDSVTPIMTAFIVPKDAANSYGSFDNLVGFVSSVTPNPSGIFIGSFNLQIDSGTGQAIPISLTADTELSGVSDLNSLETGRVVEVMATVNDVGNIIAQKVQVEDPGN